MWAPRCKIYCFWKVPPLINTRKFVSKINNLELNLLPYLYLFYVLQMFLLKDHFFTALDSKRLMCFYLANKTVLDTRPDLVIRLLTYISEQNRPVPSLASPIGSPKSPSYIPLSPIGSSKSPGYGSLSPSYCSPNSPPSPPYNFE